MRDAEGPTQRMHAGEVDTDASLVRRLLATQFPALAHLDIVRVDSFGTDHDIYRLGDEYSVRLPRIDWAEGQAELEALWLPVLAPRLPLYVTQLLGAGHPEHGYPFNWSITTWLSGTDASVSAPEPHRAARDLAQFILALRGAPTSGAPVHQPRSRGGELAELDGPLEHALRQLGGRVDSAGVRAVWRAALAADAHTGDPSWIHGDLLPGNLLVENGVITGVIDFGNMGVGDPATDLLPAWNLFSGESRELFLSEVGSDAAARLRGKGWALVQAIIALPYYWETNPRIVAQAQRAIEAVVADS